MKILDRGYSLFLARLAKKGESAEMKKFLQVCDGGEKEKSWNYGKR